MPSANYVQRWASNMRAARAARNLTQYELGRLLNIDQQNISRWESGRAVPRDDMKFRLAEFFGVTVSDLFSWDDPAEKADDDEEPVEVAS